MGSANRVNFPSVPIFSMVKVILLIFAVLLSVLAVFRLLSLYSKRRNNLTAAKVADIIQKHLQGTEGPWDWDYFISVPIRDDRLDAIRLQCLKLDQEAAENRKRELNKIIENLRCSAG